jgi:putative ABC transport system ATP-binding protein
MSADCAQTSLTSLRLIEQLAREFGVNFDRAEVRMLVREYDVTGRRNAGQRLHRLQQALFGMGLAGRVRHLSLEDAFASMPEGMHLIAPTTDLPEGDGWILIRASNRRKVRVACQEGSDVWLSLDEVRGLLGGPTAGEPLAWLLAEQALPCSAASSLPVETIADHDEHEHAVHLSPFRRLVAILKPEARDIWVVSIFSAVVGLLALATPVTVEALVNTVAFGRLLQPVIVLSLVLFGFLGFAAAIRILQTYVAEIIQRRIFVRVVADLSHRLPRVRQEAYDGVHGPELLNRFFEVMTVQKSAALLVLDGIAIVLQTAVGMAVLAFYHPLLLGFDIVLIASLAFTVFVLGRGGEATSIDESKAKYAVAEWLEQLAHCPLAFKNAGGADRAIEHADKLAIDYLRARQLHFRVLMRQIAFTLAFQALAGSVLLGIGGWLVIQGQLTLGQLVAAELIVALIVGSFAKLGKHLEAFYDLLAGVDKLGHLFDLPIERQFGEALADASTGLPLRVGEHVIEAGEFVAIVGPTGAGKSHLLATAFGLHAAEAPGSQIADVDVNSLDLAILRSQVVLVRDVEIFAGTLAENIHMGRAIGTRTAIRTCLEELRMGDDLGWLPSGLDTVLQQGGRPLTDSQARRVVLARALIGQPRLLLIDEMLDGLPDDVLPDVLEALERRTSHTTIVIATGRSDVARLCERVIALPRRNLPSPREPNPTNYLSHLAH